MSRSPGVYREELSLAPAPPERTGIPAFLGFARTGPVAAAPAFATWPRLVDLLRRESSLTADERATLQRLSSDARLSEWAGAKAEILRAEWPSLDAALRVDDWGAFHARFGAGSDGSFLSEAIRGFFTNGGSLAYVLRLDPNPLRTPLAAVTQALAALEHIADADLVCVPDAVRAPARPDTVRDLQAAVIKFCTTRGGRFAVLDSGPGLDPDGVLAQRRGLTGSDAALYYPWVRTAAGVDGDAGLVPPCGHVAGVIARTDARVGVHKAPANELLHGVLDVERAVGAADGGALNSEHVNVIRAFPGRGIRVWGARTLSEDPNWAYVPVRRVFLSAARWVEQAFAAPLFEPSGPALWARIQTRLSEHFADLHRRGALRGEAPEDAFYVRCDEETNPPRGRDAGRVVAEVGLAPALPREYVVVHIVRDADGVAITGPG